MRRPAAIMTVVAASLALAGCGSDLGMPTPVTSEGDHAVGLWRIFVWIALVIGAIVYGLIGYVVIRYRPRRNDDRQPSRRQYNVALEMTYTAIPLIIVGVLLGLSIRTENRIIRTSADPDLTVHVVGFQWQWQFQYERSNVVVTGVPGVVPVLVLPTQRTVELDLSSPDVIHSFWVPHFIEKRDLIPRVDNKIEVRINETGEWAGVCSEFCGLDHTNMRFRVRAVSPADFDRWLASGGGTTS